MSALADWELERRAVNPLERFEWTDEKVEQLKVLVAQNLAYSQIATIMGGWLTRNAVLGKASRLKLNKAPALHPLIKRARKSQAMRRAIKRKSAEFVIGKGSESAVPITPEPFKEIVDREIDGIPLMQLTASTCRWPIGDPRKLDFRFCGHDVEIAGKPYCATHRLRASGGRP